MRTRRLPLPFLRRSTAGAGSAKICAWGYGAGRARAEAREDKLGLWADPCPMPPVGLEMLGFAEVSFPLFFVFHRAGFMLPGFSHVEPDANHPETASVTCSPASSAVASGCRTPQCIRSSPPSSLRVWHSAAHGPARF